MAACGDCVERGFNANEARQTLGAARAGDQAEVHLRQTDTRRRLSDAVMRREGHFETAAEAHPMHGGHDQQRRRLDAVAEVGQMRLHRRLAEFGDVGARDKGAAFAHDHHGAHAAFGLGAVHAIGQPLPHGLAQRVDGRVFDAQYDDVVMAGIGNLVGHVKLLDLSAPGQGRCPSGALFDAADHVAQRWPHL